MLHFNKKIQESPENTEKQTKMSGLLKKAISLLKLKQKKKMSDLTENNPKVSNEQEDYHDKLRSSILTSLDGRIMDMSGDIAKIFKDDYKLPSLEFLNRSLSSAIDFRNEKEVIDFLQTLPQLLGEEFAHYSTGKFDSKHRDCFDSFYENITISTEDIGGYEDGNFDSILINGKKVDGVSIVNRYGDVQLLNGGKVVEAIAEAILSPSKEEIKNFFDKWDSEE